MRRRMKKNANPGKTKKVWLEEGKRQGTIWKFWQGRRTTIKVL